MFTIRTLGGVALFLFGTTFLWLTPMFASPGISTRGVWWSTLLNSGVEPMDIQYEVIGPDLWQADVE